MNLHFLAGVFGHCGATIFVRPIYSLGFPGLRENQRSGHFYSRHLVGLSSTYSLLVDSVYFSFYVRGGLDHVRGCYLGPFQPPFKVDLFRSNANPYSVQDNRTDPLRQRMATEGNTVCNSSEYRGVQLSFPY